MHKYYLFICLLTLFSCSKENKNYHQTRCRVEIKEGSYFTLCNQLGDSIEGIIFKENTILFGKKINDTEENINSYQIENINKIFPKNKIKFDDLNLTITNDSIKWINNNSSKASFYFDSINYYTITDSIYHFKCYGKKRSHFFGYSIYNTMIRINADIKINTINN